MQVARVPAPEVAENHGGSGPGGRLKGEDGRAEKQEAGLENRQFQQQKSDQKLQHQAGCNQFPGELMAVFAAQPGSQYKNQQPEHTL
jgi:hypothetical protein